MNPMLVWIYKLVNAIASKKCTAGKAWEPQIKAEIYLLKNGESNQCVNSL